MKAHDCVEWSVAIFSSREQPEVLKMTIMAAAKACAGRSAIISVVVNGNESLAAMAAEFVCTLEREHDWVGVRVWSIPFGDKAYAWNQYLYYIEPHATIAFYTDGYAEVVPDAFRLIATSLHDEPSRLAATGVPTHGRSAAKVRAQMLAEGGINGSLYAIRGSVMDELRRIGFHLPIGIYRTDPLVGAVLCFKFRPDQNKWDPNRILVQPDATWRIPERKFTSINDVRGYFKRQRRQALGLLVNAAVKQHLAINRDPPEDLPEFSHHLIGNWAKSSRREVVFLCLRNWLCIPALVAACKSRDVSAIDQPTRMLAETSGRIASRE